MKRRGKPVASWRMWPYPRGLKLFDNRADYIAYLDKHCTCAKWLGHHELMVGTECRAQFCPVMGTDVYAIGVFSDDPADIVHELAHVVIHLFDDIGLDINHGSSEAFTYLQAGLFGACVRALKPKEKTPCSTPSPPSSPASRSRSPSRSGSRPGSSTRSTPNSRSRRKTSSRRSPR